MTLIIRSIVLTALFAVISIQAKATHLVGGDLGYEYIGETAPGSQVYRYRVFLNIYLNCDNTSNFDSFFTLLGQDYNTPVPLGIYLEDPLLPNADKQPFQNIDLLLADTTIIEPNLPAGCGIGSGLCTNRGTFEATVDLPLNFGGYHLYFHMFSRNISITNLNNPGQTGIGYYAFVPPPLVNNSSPVFLGLPTPFLCVNDTTTFLNSATDPDGDQLVFSFEEPYDSYIPAGGIIPPPNVLTWPIPPVNFNAGFSPPQPFGAGGYAFINAVTGLTEYSSPMQGNYIVAVEVKEYRNGILIGRVRRDLQLQVIACPPNATPALTTTSQQVSYSVDAGDQLCFTAEFNDLDGDSLFVAAGGTIFDAGQFTPAATIQAPDSGAGNVSSEFCWNTGCDQGQSQPYLFSLSVSDNGCPPKTIDVVYQILVNPFTGPSAISGPSSVCSSDLTSYSVNDVGNGSTYQWLVNGGTINGSSTDTLVNVDWGGSSTGTVQLVATSQFGCEADTIDLAVTISGLPVASAGSDVTICPGQSTVIGGTPTGPAGSTYGWSSGVSLDNPAIANPNASPSTDQQYVVTVTNNGCSATDTVLVFVAPDNAEAGADLSICTGDSVQLNGSGGTNYNWTPIGNIIGPNTPTPTVFPSATTTYFMNVTDANSCAFVDSVVVTVNNLPFADAGSNASTCAGQAIILGGNPSGPAGATYSWDNGASLDDPASSNPNASPISTTTYNLSVTDGNSCVNTDAVTITVNPLPAVNAGSDASICPGDSVQLNASGASNYSWSPPNDLSATNQANPFASPSSTTTYTVSTTDANNCTGTDDVTVTVLPPPPANAGNDVSICIGDSIQLNATGGNTYSWSPNIDLSNTSIADPFASPSTTQTYTVIVTDGNLCLANDDVTVTVNQLPAVDAGADQTICEGDAASLGGAPTGPAGSSYSWSPASNLNNANTANPSASPITSSTYTVVVTDGNNCVSSDIINVIVNPSPALFAGNDTSVCSGSSLQLSAQGTGSFAWSPPGDFNNPAIANPLVTPSGTTSYNLTLTDGNGCTAEDSLVVDVLTLPTAEAGPDQWLCPGSTTTLNGSGGNAYSWTPIGSLDDPNIANPSATPAVTTTYFVTVIGANNCSSIDSVTITVNDDVPVNAGNDTTICTGDTVLLGGNPTSVNGTSYLWAPSAGLNDSSLANPLAFPSITTTYLLTVTNDTCTNTDQVLVSVQGNSNAAFSTQLEPRCDGLRAWLFNETPGAGSFLWDFGNGESSTEQNPQFVFPNGEPISITLTVVDGSGCSSSITQNLSTYNFADFVSLELPNVFTPNGDGDNDVFKPNSNVVLGPCASFSVFNRWGSEVFISTGGDIAWSGFTFAGEPAQEGTYFYILEVEGIQMKGHVQLMR